MTDHSTIWMAIDLMRAPSNVRRVRSAPLPKDVNKLLAIAAGDEAVLSEAKARHQSARNTLFERPLASTSSRSCCIRMLIIIAC